MPYGERKRLMPHMVESQRLHILQCKEKAIQAHKRHMRDLDEWMKNLDRELAKYGLEAASTNKPGRITPIQ